MRKTAREFLDWLYRLPSSEVSNTLAVVGVLINVSLLAATAVLAIYSYRQWKAVDDTLQEIKKQTPAVLQTGRAAELSAKTAVNEAASSDASTQIALGEMKKQSQAAHILASATQAVASTSMKQLDLSERPLLVIADTKLTYIGVNSFADMSFGIDVQIDNSGRTPAINTALIPALILPPGITGSLTAEMMKVCHSADKFGPLSGEMVPQGEKGYHISRTIMGTERGSLRSALKTAFVEPQSGSRPISSTLVVCVLYRSLISSQVHHTALLYNVQIVLSAGEAAKIESGSMAKDEPIWVQSDRISLHKQVIINGLAD